MITVLVVDDEYELRDGVAKALRGRGFEVIDAATAKAARRTADEAACRIDVILLDLWLDDPDPYALLREFANKNFLVIVMTAKSFEKPQGALNAGAADWVSKRGVHESWDDFIDNVSARINAVLRRNRPAANPPSGDRPTYRFDRWRLDTKQRALIGEDGVELYLSGDEYKLLVALLERPREARSRERLLEDIGKATTSSNRVDTNRIDKLVSGLRRKIERDRENPEIVGTVRNVGYALRAEVTRS